MSDKTVEQRAKTDPELARFLKREKNKRDLAACRKTGKHSKSYAANHLPASRDLSEAAADAIRDMTVRGN